MKNRLTPYVENSAEYTINPKISMKHLTIKKVFLRIIGIIAVAEFLIMLALRNHIQEASIFLEAIIDATFLAALSAPAIYFWVIKPFVNERDEALSRITHLAHVDPLTLLANRRSIFNNLEKIMSGNVRHKDHGAILVIDLDEFKAINDNYGHEAGDTVLVKVAARLISNVRSLDVVGRLGGDEFVVLINRLGSDRYEAHKKVSRIAEKLVISLDEPFDFNGNNLRVGASIGVRFLNFEELDTNTIIREADIAMYIAKRKGGGNAVFFEK